MTISKIGQVEPPTWLHNTPMMLSVRDHEVRSSWGEEFQATTILGDRPRTIVDRQDGCGCLIDSDDNHHGNAVVLNPAGTGRIALLYENLMYVSGGGYTITASEDTAFPYATADRHRSMWWVKVAEETEPGWYTWDGTPTRNRTNPAVPDGSQVMITDAAHVARASGRMMTVSNTTWGGSLTGRVIGDPVSNDNGGELTDINVRTWIALAPEYQEPEPVPEWVDPTADMTHAQKIERLNERFQRLVTGAREMAVEEDWCGEYENSSEEMGISEEDYNRRRREPVTYELQIALTYSLSASTLDDVLNDHFDGSHDVRNSVDVVSYVTVTVTQEDGEEFDEDEHDIDDVLENAGYTGYDEFNIESERQV